MRLSKHGPRVEGEPVVEGARQMRLSKHGPRVEGVSLTGPVE